MENEVLSPIYTEGVKNWCGKWYNRYRKAFIVRKEINYLSQHYLFYKLINRFLSFIEFIELKGEAEILKSFAKPMLSKL